MIRNLKKRVQGQKSVPRPDYSTSQGYPKINRSDYSRRNLEEQSWLFRLMARRKKLISNSYSKNRKGHRHFGYVRGRVDNI